MTLLALCQDLGWVVNVAKLELIPNQVLNFAGYWFDLFRSLVTPTQEKSLFQARKQLAHNFSRTESSPAGPQKVKCLCWGRTIVVTDNVTVVLYINKEEGMRSGSLCALLWRLLPWCNLRQIVLKARHIPGHLHMIVHKLSRHRQVIQTK